MGNDLKYIFMFCKKYLEEKERKGILQNMDLLFQSIDLNPIKLLKRIRQSYNKKYSTCQRRYEKFIRRLVYIIYQERNYRKINKEMLVLNERVKSKEEGFFAKNKFNN